MHELLKHAGKLPQGFAEQQEFRKLIEKQMEDLEEPDNYPEALSNAAYAFKPPNQISDEVQKVLDICDKPPSNDIFWTYIQALKMFISEKGRTAVSGLIPDFHSDTKSYVKIKQLYNQSAENDFKSIYSIASKFTDTKLNEDEVRSFSRNWQFSECIEIRAIEDSVLCDWMYDEHAKGFGWYFVFRAADSFLAREGRHPTPADKDVLMCMAVNEVKKSGVSVDEFKVADMFVEEM